MVDRRQSPNRGFDEAVQNPPAGPTLHGLFEEQAARTPANLAVEHDQRFLTYEELNERANRLARRLRDHGVVPDLPVALLLENSIELVAAVLAVLKAGGAFVPIDPTHPVARIRHLLRDSAAHLLLTHRGLSSGLDFEGEVLDLDRHEALAGDGGNLDPVVGSADLAYVIYTSGSTGTPKGVMVTHSSVVNYLTWARRTYSCDEALTCALYSSIAFDLTVTSLFMPLISGGLVVIYAGGDGSSLIRRILEEDRVGLLKLTPAHLRALAAADLRTQTLRRLVVGGEELGTELARTVHARLGGKVEIFNEYGPTEATVACTVHRFDPKTDTGATVPIGRAADNQRVHVLGPDLEPVAPGQTGELYIGGQGLARGYLDRPELTAEVFVTDPGDPSGQRRLYRTGDLGRLLPSGELEFLGRVDDQVKIRGYRIEPSEIAAALTGLSEVREAVVVPRRAADGEQSLVAYVVPNGLAPDASKLRRAVAETLPNYMLPAAYVLLDELPLTPAGKVDRRALPPPGSRRPDLSQPLLSPRDATEACLATIWAELLGLDEVGVEDDLFDLGGHSLLVTQMAVRVAEVFGVELPLDVVFDSPTVAATAEAVRAAETLAPTDLAPPIPPPPRPDRVPLSHSQERVWFIQQLFPDNRAYHAQATFAFTGSLDVGALERSLSEILRRHEIYRTTFEQREGSPVQVVHSARPWRLPLVDLGKGTPEQRRLELERHIDAEVAKPIDPTRLPLVRWILYRLSDNEHVMLHVEHHLVHDGWAFNVLVRELQALYRAEVEGRPSPLAEPLVQFADFAIWQRRWMEGAEAQRQLAYWTRQLRDAPSEIALPFDRPRGSVQTFRGAAPRLELEAELCTALRELSRRQGVTLFMTMLAAFTTLLHRCSGEEELCVGTGIANRRWPGTEGLMGMIINNLVLRLDLAGDPPFPEVLRQVRDVTLDAYAHQDVPFDWVVEAVRPERDPGRNPLFQTAFSFHDAPLPELDFPGLEVGLTEAISNCTAKFDLNIVVIARSEQRVGFDSAGEESSTVIWEYNSDLFDSVTIEGLFGAYDTLLRGIAADPTRRISELPLMTPAERRRIVHGFNDTATDYPRQETIHALFSNQAEATPDSVALVMGRQELTYGQLDRLSNQLAHVLADLGVGPGVAVGLCTGRSLEMVTATLGILKAGGTYVPLDPGYPAQRLEHMVHDTEMPLVITQTQLRPHVPVSPARVLCVDQDQGLWATAPADPPPLRSTAESAAYVMYTSGSTGMPKGVEVPHRGVVRLVRNTDYVELGPDETLLQLAPTSFDASTFEIWGALLNGARLAIFPEERYTLSELARAVRSHGVTTLWLTAPLFHQMVEEHLHDLAGVRQLLAGGDVLSPSHVRRVLEELPGCTVINGYGPTEATTFTCCHRMTAADAPDGPVPIGRPIANTRVYILDRHGQPVLPRVAGELVVAGDGLARGYLNDPALTAERFPLEPFSEKPTDRAYRTGDLARHRHDGTVEFLGRMDTQLKIRGFRVEPGEIEAALRLHPAVADVVVASSELGDTRRLVAYVVPADQGLPPHDELRATLRERVPDHMMPAVFVELESLPKTPSGKLDRSALPEPKIAPGSEAPEEPSTPTERAIAAIWKDVLGLEAVGAHDNFFDLGGHSLIGTQVASRVLSTLQVELPLAAVFSAPTIAELARVVDGLPPAATDPDEPALTRQPRRSTTES